MPRCRATKPRTRVSRAGVAASGFGGAVAETVDCPMGTSLGRGPAPERGSPARAGRNLPSTGGRVANRPRTPDEAADQQPGEMRRLAAPRIREDPRAPVQQQLRANTLMWLDSFHHQRPSQSSLRPSRGSLADAREQAERIGAAREPLRTRAAARRLGAAYARCRAGRDAAARRTQRAVVAPERGAAPAVGTGPSTSGRRTRSHPYRRTASPPTRDTRRTVTDRRSPAPST